MKGLSPGRKVHYVVPKDPGMLHQHVAGEHRPMEVVTVRNKEAGSISGIVFLDGSNDSTMTVQVKGTYRQPTTGTESESVWQYPLTQLWVPSVPYSEAKEPGTWHWPEYVE